MKLLTQRMLTVVLLVAGLESTSGAEETSAPADGTLEPLPGPMHYADTYEIYDGLLSPDGSWLVTSSEEGYDRPQAKQGYHSALALWDVTKGELVRRGSVKAPYALADRSRLRVQRLGWGPDGKTLLAYLESRYLEILSFPALESQAFVDVKKSEFHYYRSARFSPDGAWLALGDGEGEVALWSVAERQRVTSWKAHEKDVITLAFSPDSKTLVTGSQDDTVRLWTLPSLKLIKKISWKDGPPITLAISPDGKWLAIGSRMKGKFAEVRLWSMERKRFAATRPCAVLFPSVTFAFAPDGKTLAMTCSIGLGGEYHGILDFVALEDGRLLARDQRKAVFTQLAFLPNGRLLTRHSRIYRGVAGDRNEQSIAVWDRDPLRFSHYLHDPAARP